MRSYRDCGVGRRARVRLGGIIATPLRMRDDELVTVVCVFVKKVFAQRVVWITWQMGRLSHFDCILN